MFCHILKNKKKTICILWKQFGLCVFFLILLWQEDNPKPEDSHWISCPLYSNTAPQPLSTHKVFWSIQPKESSKTHGELLFCLTTLGSQPHDRESKKQNKDVINNNKNILKLQNILYFLRRGSTFDPTLRRLKFRSGAEPFR